MDILQRIKKHRWIILIFLFALIIRIIFVFSTPIKIWDETVYANLGYNLANNPLDYSVKNNGWSDFIPSGGDPIYSWPKMGFRAPLLPYFLMMLYLFHFNFLVVFFLAVIGASSVFLVYLFGKSLFNKKVGIYSAILLSLIPLHITYSSKILTDVLFTFFILLTFFSFWKGYEKGNKIHKVLFGFFLALSLLSRYTTFWVIPIFLIYFLVRDKSLLFLKKRYFWYSVIFFFITLLPWFIYGTYEYSNPLGAFIHGFKASSYWGGIQSWNFFFEHWWQMFSITGFIFALSLIYILYKKEFLKKEIYLLLIWFTFFLGMAIYMPHKEDRFILVLAPIVSLISGYFLDRIKKYKNVILFGIIIISLFSISYQFYLTYINSHTDTNNCFLESNKFLEKLNKNSVIITDESAVVYYYTKLETKFYPNPWNYSLMEEWREKFYSDKEVYILFGSNIMKPEEEFNLMKTDLETKSNKVFECSKNEGYSSVYKL